jgi:hypothetical protein
MDLDGTCTTSGSPADCHIHLTGRYAVGHEESPVKEFFVPRHAQQPRHLVSGHHKPLPVELKEAILKGRRDRD